MRKGTIIIIVLLVLVAVATAIFIFIKKKEAEEAAVESFLGTKNKRGIRNNNLGNIKLTSSEWEGEIPHSQNTDGVFKQFKTLSYGTMQMIDLLITYFSKGRNTIRKIISFWDLNNTVYMDFLSNYTGFGVDEILTPNENTLKKLSQGIARFENGEDFLTDARFYAGYKLLNQNNA